MCSFPMLLLLHLPSHSFALGVTLYHIHMWTHPQRWTACAGYTPCQCPNGYGDLLITLLRQFGNHNGQEVCGGRQGAMRCVVQHCAMELCWFSELGSDAASEGVGHYLLVSHRHTHKYIYIYIYISIYINK